MAEASSWHGKCRGRGEGNTGNSGTAAQTNIRAYPNGSLGTHSGVGHVTSFG
jgi:hypothetical protein